MISIRNMPQLSSAKPRCGLQQISDLIPRLVRQYEMQAELQDRRQRPEAPVVIPTISPSTQQSTFCWYE